MAAYAGNVALWLSLFFSLFQFIGSRKKYNFKIISISVNGLIISSLVSFFFINVLLYNF